MVRCPAVLRGSRAALAPQDDGRASNHEADDPVIALVLARAENGAIGRGGDLPWRLSSDMRYFRKITIGKPIIMGRLTFASLGRALDGRVNIVLTRNAAFEAPGAIMAYNIDEALEVARKAATKAGVDEIMVIGGEDVFRAALPQASRIYLTEVHASPHADIFLHELDLSGFRELTRQRHEPGPRDEYPFSFVLLERRRGA
jgi:dihydrofolate reductase